MNPVLNYACGWFVPPDQFEAAEACSEIFFTILTCWFKSSVVGEMFCVLFFICNCSKNRDAEIKVKVTAVAPGV